MKSIHFSIWYQIPCMVSELLVLYRVIYSFIYLIFYSMSDASSMFVSNHHNISWCRQSWWLYFHRCFCKIATQTHPWQLSYMAGSIYFFCFWLWFAWIHWWYIIMSLSNQSHHIWHLFLYPIHTKPCMPSPDATRSLPLSFHYSLDFWKSRTSSGISSLLSMQMQIVC